MRCHRPYIKDYFYSKQWTSANSIMFDPESFSLDQTLRISNRVLWEENKITRKSCVEEINKDNGGMKNNK